jgi:hypothetical protein
MHLADNGVFCIKTETRIGGKRPSMKDPSAARSGSA